MVTLSAKWVSLELLELLEEKEYKVHSRFDSGCNLSVEDILCYIGNKNDMKLPYAVIINQEDVQKLNMVSDFYWNSIKQQFESANLIIQTEDAVRFSSKIEKKSYLGDTVLTDDGPQDDFAQSKLSLIAQAIDETLMTGFDKPIADLMPEKNSDVAELLRCIHGANQRIEKSDSINQDDIDATRIRNILKKFVGYGKGLTPSGDDFLQGVLYIQQLTNKLESIDMNHTDADKTGSHNTAAGDTFLQVLTDLLNTGYTTDTSVHYYRCAMRGLFTEPLVNIATAYANVEQDESGATNLNDTKATIQSNMDKLLTFGHTSGRDTAAGILAAVKGMELL